MPAYGYTGLDLVAIAMVLLVAELFLPTSGVLAAAGIVAFVAGVLFLVDTDMRRYGISWPLILVLAGFGLLFALLAVRMAVKARRRPVTTGQEQLVGAPGEVLADFTGEGWATVLGETWRVRSAAPLAQGQRIRVTHVDGLTLDVELQSIPPIRSTS